MGNICIVFNILLYAAPLATLGEVLKTRSSSSLSMEQTVTNLTLSGGWLVAGIWRSDLPSIIPNGIGVVLSVVQLLLFLLFPAVGGQAKRAAKRKSN